MGLRKVSRKTKLYLIYFNKWPISGIEEHVNINNMNGSAVGEIGSLAASASRTDVYSSIERRMQEADSLKVTYKIAAEGKRCNKPGMSLCTLQYNMYDIVLD